MVRDQVITRLYINPPITVPSGLRLYSDRILNLGLVFFCDAVNITKYPLTPVTLVILECIYIVCRNSVPASEKPQFMSVM
jgi:hypothetical protein